MADEDAVAAAMRAWSAAMRRDDRADTERDPACWELADLAFAVESLDELRAFATATRIPLNVLIAYSDTAEAWPPASRRPHSAAFTAHVRLASKDDRVQRLDALIAEHGFVTQTVAG